jgi:hypothetical protein
MFSGLQLHRKLCNCSEKCAASHHVVLILPLYIPLIFKEKYHSSMAGQNHLKIFPLRYIPFQRIDKKGETLFYKQYGSFWHSSCSIAKMLSLGISHRDDTGLCSYYKMLGVICIASWEELCSLS